MKKAITLPDALRDWNKIAEEAEAEDYVPQGPDKEEKFLLDKPSPAPAKEY